MPNCVEPTVATRRFQDAEMLERLLYERHSCRAFCAAPVPRNEVERILALAQRTASWCNAQPWRVLLVEGAALVRFRAALAAHAAAEPPQPDFDFPREYRGVYRERRRECAGQLYDSVGVARGDREASERQTFENFRLFGAPQVAIVTADEALGVYGAIDCGAYVANFMLAAASLGVATIAQAALAAHARFVRAFFALPADRKIVCSVAFGYENAAHPVNRFRTPRAPLSESVDWVEN